MSFMTTNNCCFCISLRTGCFIIAYLLLAEQVIGLTIVCFQLSSINQNLVKYYHYSVLHEELGISKMILSFRILLLTFEILLCIALLNGLYKKIQDQIQMFYIGGWFFLVLRTILFIAVSMHFGKLMKARFDATQWILYAMEILVLVVTLYFFAVIRSYYYLLRSEYKTMNMKNSFSSTLKV